MRLCDGMLCIPYATNGGAVISLDYGSGGSPLIELR